ncbi:hypothetical protein [Streptomyces sp. EKS3.2]|uniref:hypothetical protein n=1 Tax=Streptomyces sp. EKS3.2 TaxID=3461008 RepID=UPI0040425D6D
MKKQYRVTLHAHATAVVFVEASDGQEANRLAYKEAEAGRVKPLRIKPEQWTAVMTIDMNGPRA